MGQRGRGSAQVLAAAAVMAIVATGCGSSTTKTANEVGSFHLPSAAASRLAAATRPVTAWPGPDVAFKPPRGERITVITCEATGATCVRVANGAVAAGKVLGWHVTVVDGKGSPTTWNSAFTAAIAARTQGIILAGVPPLLVGGGLAAAKKAGIPVVYALGKVAEGADQLVAPDRATSGLVLADYVAESSGGKAQVLVLQDHEFPELDQMDASFDHELSTVCPGCKVAESESFTLASMAQQLPTTVQTALQSHPGITDVLGPYDAASTFIDQGIRAAGKTGVSVLGTGGDAPTIASLRSGAETASMGVPAEWEGWQAVDAIGRHLAGKPYDPAPSVQSLLTRPTIASLAPDGTYSGGYDYAAHYEKLWGVG